MKSYFNMCLSLCSVLALFSCLLSCTSETQPSPSAASPAKVANRVKESELTTVMLSPEAEQRLGIETAAVEKRKVARAFKLGGEIVAIPGRQVMITAPLAGVVLAPPGLLPQAGMHVRKGQVVFRLLPLPNNSDILGTPEEVKLKKMQLEVATAKAQRAQQLLQDKAGSVKSMEEAQAELAAAEAAFKTAEARLHLSNNATADSAVLASVAMTLASPFGGIIQKINVTPRQTVAAGSELFEVVSQSPIWVRVPIYTGDLTAIDEQQSTQVEALGYASGAMQRAAKPVQGPPRGNANAASADLFFEMSNDDNGFHVGEKVRVAIARKSTEENLIVPFSAILYDIHGGTWVYVKTMPQVYVRRRVELHHVTDGLAVLARGPSENTEVVVTGAMEIFGTEFGGGK